MDVVLVVSACVVLLIAVVLVQSNTSRSITARIHALNQNLERIERSTRDDFATNRRESGEALQRLSESLVHAQSALGDADAKQLQTFGTQLESYTRSAADEFAQLRTEVRENNLHGDRARDL